MTRKYFEKCCGLREWSQLGLSCLRSQSHCTIAASKSRLLEERSCLMLASQTSCSVRRLAWAASPCTGSSLAESSSERLILRVLCSETFMMQTLLKEILALVFVYRLNLVPQVFDASHVNV